MESVNSEKRIVILVLIMILIIISPLIFSSGFESLMSQTSTARGFQAYLLYLYIAFNGFYLVLFPWKKAINLKPNVVKNMNSDYIYSRFVIIVSLVLIVVSNLLFWIIIVQDLSSINIAIPFALYPIAFMHFERIYYDNEYFVLYGKKYCISDVDKIVLEQGRWGFYKKVTLETVDRKYTIKYVTDIAAKVLFELLKEKDLVGVDLIES